MCEAVLINAFNDTGAKYESSEVYMYGNIQSKIENFNDIEKLANIFKKDIGFISSSYNEIKSEFLDKLKIEGTKDDKTTVNVEFQINRKTREKIIILCANFKYLNSSKITSSVKILKNIFKKYQVIPETNICIVGTFDGKLDDTRSESIINKILIKTKSKQLDKIKDGTLISVSGQVL